MNLCIISLNYEKLRIDKIMPLLKDKFVFCIIFLQLSCWKNIIFQKFIIFLSLAYGEVNCT